MINSKYLLYHDLIGIHGYAKPVLRGNIKNFLDIGIIINETRNMIITEKDNKIRKYIKKDYIFRLKLPNYNNGFDNYYLEFHGNKIVGLPVNRLRSLKKKRWFKR